MGTKAAFEKWLKEKMPNLYHMAFIAEEDEMTNHFKASVLDMRTAWEGAWQASRSAIEIEIEPLSEQYFASDIKNSFEHGRETERKATIQVLTSHGIRIKDK